MDSLFGKAEDALDGFLGDQEKVDKAKAKAKELLGQHMDQSQADELVDKGEGFLQDYEQKHR